MRTPYVEPPTWKPEGNLPIRPDVPDPRKSNEGVRYGKARETRYKEQPYGLTWLDAEMPQLATENLLKSERAWLSFGLRQYGTGIAEVYSEPIRDFVNYMRSISTGSPDERITTPEMAGLALTAWVDLYDAFGPSLPTPRAGVAEDGHVGYVWRKEEHYLEMENFPTGHCELFYRNRTTGELWGEEYESGTPITSTVLEKLKLIA